MLEFDDIQAYILTGYGHQKFSCFFFYEITDATRARGWLAGLVPNISHARKREPDEKKPETSVNIAFSIGGLAALGLDSASLNSFPYEFNGGSGYSGPANPMALKQSSELLEDWDESAPEHWHFGGPNTAPTHMVLMLFATTVETLEDHIRMMAASPDNGVRTVYQQHSNRLGDREAFGFHDGIAQPGIEGSYIANEPGESSVKPGEFILGYIDEYGTVAPGPSVGAAQDPLNILPPLDSGEKDLGKNGSYLAIRKLKQKVDAFWEFCSDKTRNADGSENPEKKIWLASKMVGRWPSGAPMALTSDRDDPALGADPKRNNDFLYSGDPEGLKCPMGAHLRRGNPRDDLRPDDPATSSKVTARHRIIRRGRPYNDSEGNEKGLMFMAVNADIQRQFEFVMQTWINSPKFGDLYDNKDPILARPELLDPAPNGSASSVMVIPATPLRQRVRGLRRFVEVRGGGYFFLPGLRALRFLSSDHGKAASVPAPAPTPAPSTL